MGGRSRWLATVSDRVSPDRLSAVDGFAGLTPCERALVTVHVGLGHMLGVAETDLVVDGFVSGKAINYLISHWWRSGSADELTSSYLLPCWIALFQLGRDTGVCRADLLAQLLSSQAGRRIQQYTSSNLSPVAGDVEALRDLLMRSEAVEFSVETETHQGRAYWWEVEGSHLDLVRGLVEQHGVRALAGKLSLLELIASMSSGPEVGWAIEALRKAKGTLHVHRSMPGGWPGPGLTDIPSWVRDVVTVNGARMFNTSAGYVSAWMFVAETDEELHAVNRWSYAPAMGLDLDQDQRGVTFVVPLEFGPADTGYLTYHYNVTNASSLNWLRALLAVGVLRIEVYRLDPSSRLQYVTSFGFLLPEEIREAGRAIVSDLLAASGEPSWFTPMAALDGLTYMRQIERTFFENLAVCAPELDRASSVGIAYRHRLQILKSATADWFRGAAVDDRLLSEATEKLRIEVSKSTREALEPLPIENLGPGRAIVQFVATLDAPLTLRAYTAYVDDETQLHYETFEFSAELDLSQLPDDLEELTAYLAEGLRRLREIQEKGIKFAVVSAGAGIYNLPFHEALLALGFEEASFTHRVESLLPRPAVDGAGDSLVLGFSGEGASHIPAVDTEVAIVRSITQAAHNDDFHTGPLPSVVHLAGHARTGSREYEVGIQLGPAAPLSAAAVMLDLDLSETDVVFLSACSTGAGDFPVGELIGATPLDVTFIEKGAQVVISTSAPIDDLIACFYASIFHSALAGGTSVWESYRVARAATASASVPDDMHALHELLASQWPTWKDDIMARNRVSPGQWRLFRISGRHW
ncbi:hypothetical protein GCM10008097_26800 [Mycetocola manganoxydans]|nr:hypothetical protein GCM10008097_26800 [Mycetocola manganoxydans]